MQNNSSFRELYDEGAVRDMLKSAYVAAGLGGAVVGAGDLQNKVYDANLKSLQLNVPEKSQMSNLWADQELEKPKEVQKVQVQKSDYSKPWTDSNGAKFNIAKAMDFIADFEEFRPKAYRDGKIVINGQKVTRYSIGYGTPSPGNDPNATISEEDAREAMYQHIKRHVLPKYQHFDFPSQNQFNTAISFTYNTGKLPPITNQGTIDWERFLTYNNADGKRNSGLERRRNAEFFNAQLFDEV